jgi:hypothetical protein
MALKLRNSYKFGNFEYYHVLYTSTFIITHLILCYEFLMTNSTAPQPYF